MENNNPTNALISQHGFDIEDLAAFQIKGLRPDMLLQAINQGLDPEAFRRAIREGFDAGTFAGALERGLEVWLFTSTFGTNVHILNAALCRALEKNAGV